MTENAPSDQHREINDAERAYFVEVLEGLTSLLRDPYSADYALFVDFLSDDMSVTDDIQEGHFRVGEEYIRLERKATTYQLEDDVSTETEISWYICFAHKEEHGSDSSKETTRQRIFKIGDEQLLTDPSYEVHYTTEDLETGERQEMKPGLSDAAREAWRNEPDEHRQLQILLDDIKATAARTQELEELTGIDNSSCLTPERMYKAIELLREVTSDSQFDPYSE